MYNVDSFVEIAGWDPSKIRDKLLRDIDAHAMALQAEKLVEMANKYEVSLLAIAQLCIGLCLCT